MILNRKIKRDFFQNIIRNGSMSLIIALAMALVVSLCSASDSIYASVSNEWEQCNVEDGFFETYTPLSERNFKDLSQLDVRIEKMFYTDIKANSSSVLRIFAVRQSIDLPFAESGSIPYSGREIFLEKNYASLHGFSVGDEIEVAGENFTICGIGCFPDYCYVKQSTSDVAANDEFSVAMVTETERIRLSKGEKTIYNYAFKLGDCTVRELKKKLSDLKFDRLQVTDTYLKGMIASSSDLKTEFNESTAQLKGGAAAVADGIDTLGKNLNSAGIDANTKMLYEGALTLRSGIEKFQKRFGRYIDSNTEIDLPNLSGFGETKYNIRITDAVDDSKIGKQSALVAGVFLLILLVYMLSVFASGTIEKERPVIGTLYALGYTKDEILSHYIKTPLAVSAIGAAAGTVCGFLLTDAMASSYCTMYSFPKIKHVYPLYLVSYSLGMPIIFSYFVNRLVLSKKLNLSPLKMMREAPKGGANFNLKLDGVPFERKYKIRQFLRELSGNITLFFGIIVSLMLIMFSIACYGSISEYINNITNDVNADYMYILRNPVTDLPKNPCVGYTRGFYADFPMTGGEMEVTLLGIDLDNPYFDFASALTDDADKIYMSDAARIKFGYKVGDRVILHDNSEDRLYAFEIAGEVKYGSGLYFFMNIDAMRNAFGQDYFDAQRLKKGERRPKSEYYYYNTVFSSKPLTFGHNMLISEIVKADMKKGAEKFMALMSDMILMLICVSVIIFAAVMYLLMKLEIDRSSFSVSLLKALGYSEKTVNSLYLSPSLFVTAAAMAIGIPICRFIVNFAYPYCVSNANCGFEAVIPPGGYVLVVAIIAAAYTATRYALTKHLKKINVTEILKNRE